MKYIIVPASDAVDNYGMLNQSTASSFSIVRQNNTVTKYLFKAKSDPPHDVFNDYQWYSHDEILIELENSEWQ